MVREDLRMVSKGIKNVSNMEKVNAPGSLLIKTMDILLNMAVQVDKSSQDSKQYEEVMQKLETGVFKSVMDALGFKDDSQKVLNLLKFMDKGPTDAQIAAYLKVPQNRPSDLMLKMML